MSPRLLRFILAISIGCVASARAGEVAPAPEVPAYVLKNKSSFAAGGEGQRAPFWPIGWVKRSAQQVAAAPVRAVAAPKVMLDIKAFKVTSILLGNPSFAIINGRTYSEGEFLRMPRTVAVVTAPPVARVRVYRISDGKVVLQSEDQLVTVSLQRPELVQRTGVEELLNEDRP